MGEQGWFQLADEGMLDIKEMYCRIGKVNNYHMFQCSLARVQIPPATLWNGAVRWCLCLNYSWPASMSRGGEREEEVFLLSSSVTYFWSQINAKSMGPVKLASQATGLAGH